LTIAAAESASDDSGDRNDVISERLAGYLRDIGIPMAAGLVLLSASLANFLNRNDYGFLRLDVALVVALFTASSAAIALFYRGQRQWGRSLLEGLLACIFVDLNSTNTLLALGVGATVAGYTFWRRSSLLGPMTVLGTFVLLTTVLGFQGRWSWMRTASGNVATSQPVGSQPAVLHIILDEHLGLEGFSVLGPGGVGLRNELEAAYVGAGFTVYGRTYSEHMHTANAIPQVLNYGRRLGIEHNRAGVKIGPTEHLQYLAKSGYALKIFQSDFADICSGATYSSCTTYDSFSLRPLLDAPLTVTERAKIISLKFLTLSQLSYSALDIWNRARPVAVRMGFKAPHLKLTTAALTSSVASFAALDRLNSQLSVARPGEAHVVHLLIPHYPYVLSRDCKLLPRSSWDWRLSNSPMERKQLAYMEQVRCVTAKVLKAVELFRLSPGGKNGAVIIHGDHGSRITRIDPKVGSVGRYGDADLIAAFSTFFAVRTANGEGGTVDGAQPITPLVRDFARRGFSSPPQLDPAAVRGVYLDDKKWQPSVRVPMVEEWIKPPSSNTGKR
jgi:hypothetical protein